MVSQRGKSRNDDQAVALSVPAARGGWWFFPLHTLPGSDKPTEVHNAGLKKVIKWNIGFLKQESCLGNLAATERAIASLRPVTITNKEVLSPGSLMYIAPSL